MNLFLFCDTNINTFLLLEDLKSFINLKNKGRNFLIIKYSLINNSYDQYIRLPYREWFYFYFRIDINTDMHITC